MADTCRSCGAPIRFVRMTSGRWNPLNPVPDRERGNVVLDTDDIGTALGPEEALGVRQAGATTYLSHFATCPHRQQHRRGGNKPR